MVASGLESNVGFFFIFFWLTAIGKKKCLDFSCLFRGKSWKVLDLRKKMERKG